MTSMPLMSVLDSDTLEKAQKAMLKGDVRRLMVRSKSSGEVIGLLSVDDLARAGMKKMAGQVIIYNAISFSSKSEFQVIRETAVLHRERQAIPSITVSDDFAEGK
jgi:hypothetical protein